MQSSRQARFTRRHCSVAAAVALAVVAACAGEATRVNEPLNEGNHAAAPSAAPWTLRIAAFGSWAENGDVAGFHEDPSMQLGEQIKAVSNAPVVVYSIKIIDYIFTDSVSGQPLKRQRAEFTEISKGATDANGRFEMAVSTGDRYEVVVGPSHTRFNGGAYAVLPRAASDTSAARLLMGFVDHWPGQLPPATP